MVAVFAVREPVTVVPSGRSARIVWIV